MKNEVPRMTKMHFEYLAAVMKSLKPDVSVEDPVYKSWELSVRTMTHALSRTNGAFRDDQFRVACGLDIG